MIGDALARPDARAIGRTERTTLGDADKRPHVEPDDRRTACIAHAEHVERCMLRAAGCMSHVACRMSRVACRMSHVACCMLHVACCMLDVA